MQQQYEPTARVSDNQNAECQKFLHFLAIGEIVQADKCLSQMEHLRHYAGAVPDARQFRNFLHCVRSLLTNHLLTTKQGERAIDSLKEFDTWA